MGNELPYKTLLQEKGKRRIWANTSIHRYNLNFALCQGDTVASDENCVIDSLVDNVINGEQ